MDIPALSELEIHDVVNEAERQLRPKAARLWEIIKLMPEKWQENKMGSRIEGFWVIGILGKNIIWYNEFEEEFVLSKYSTYGEIPQYFSNNSSLYFIIEQLIRHIDGELAYNSK